MRRRAQRRAPGRHRARALPARRAQPHVTTVITVPPSLDDATFEQVLDQLAPLPSDAKVLVDARHTRWASPYGLTALLTLAQTRAERAAFTAARSEDTVSYWARTGFFRHAEELFDCTGSVPRARQAASRACCSRSRRSRRARTCTRWWSASSRRRRPSSHDGLNISIQGDDRLRDDALGGVPEHRRARGARRLGRGADVHVAKRLGRRVVVIAVCDAGIGFRRSLESAHGRAQRPLGRRRWRSRRR